MSHARADARRPLPRIAVPVAVEVDASALPRIRSVLQKIDTAPLAPCAALADLDEREALLVTDVTRRCLLAVDEAARAGAESDQGLPDPQIPT